MKRYWKIFRQNLRWIPKFSGLWSRCFMLEMREELLRKTIQDMRDYKKSYGHPQIVYSYPVIQVDGKFLCATDLSGTLPGNNLRIEKIVVISGKLINLVTEPKKITPKNSKPKKRRR